MKKQGFILGISLKECLVPAVQDWDYPFNNRFYLGNLDGDAKCILIFFKLISHYVELDLTATKTTKLT